MQSSSNFLSWIRHVLSALALVFFVSVAVVLLLGPVGTAWSRGFLFGAIVVPLATWQFRMDRRLNLRASIPYVLGSIPLTAALAYIHSAASSPASEFQNIALALVVG